MAGKVNLPEIPWFEAEFDEEDFRQWYSENPEACSEYLREKKNEYETIRRGLRFQEPHPMHYEFGVDDPRYASDLRVWENAVAMDTVLKAHKPPPQPQPLSPGMKVLLHGNEEDKNEFRERMSLVKAALEARESEDHERRLGNVTKAADYASRAGAFEREIKKREKNFEFSFQAEEKKQDLEFGMTKAEEMMKWTPQQVWENLSTVENILEGWRHMSDAEYSYLLDTGSPYSTVGAEPTYKVIKVSHPGIPANQLHARSGQTTEQGLLDYARRVGFDIERHEEPVSETVGEREGEEVSRGEFDASLKPL